MTAAGTPSTARPMDGPLLSRLYQMGIVKRDGEINVENMRLFTRIYAAQFYYNLCDSYAKSTVGTVLASFDELSGRKDYKGIYLFLSLQYDQQAAADGRIIVARISAYMLYQHLGTIYGEAVGLRIKSAYVLPVNISIYSPEGAESGQFPGDFHRADVSGVPYFITILKVFQVFVIPKCMSIR